MKPRVLITRKIFDEALSLVKSHFDVEDNPSDLPFSKWELIEHLQGKRGAIVRLTDQIDEEVVSQCKELKVISNVAVGYNNIDVEACSRYGIMVTNTPGVLDDTTADFTWALLLSTARRVVEADRYLRSLSWKGWELMDFLGYDIHHKIL